MMPNSSKKLFIVIGPSGHGKTASSKIYEENNKKMSPNTFLGNFHMDERKF
jgi:guanylate kinase